MRGWLFRLIWRDPILRVRLAWHVLRGRPLAYRLNTAPTLRVGSQGWAVECVVRFDEQPTPNVGIEAAGSHLRLIRNMVIGRGA